MPDENKAATEHALLQEITAPLATLPDDPLNSVADVDFPIVLRGYDRLAVDAYVKRTSQLVAELQATRSPEAAVRRGLERVGEEVSGILQRAHEAGSQITAQSRSEAEDRLERAREEATKITADSERRLQELDTETDRIWAERQRIVDDARQLAQELLTLAQAAADRFPAADDPEGTPGASRPFGVEVPDELAGSDALDDEGFGQAAEEPVDDGYADAEAARGGQGLTGPEGAEPDPEHLPAEGTGEPVGGATEDADDIESTRVMRPITPPDEGEAR